MTSSPLVNGIPAVLSSGPMLYRFAKPFVSFALGQFFERITVTGAPLAEEGPVIIASNHPNMLIDSLLIYRTLRRDLWFLAKSTLFSGPLISQFLASAHVLPVYRRMDGSDPRDNERTFELVTERLKQGGAIAIFPEGTSALGRRVLQLKSGAARMALQAEEAHDFNLGVRLQPIGITYSDPVSYRSSVTLTVGDPIVVASFKERYLINPGVTVREITRRLDESLRALTVEVVVPDFDRLVEKIARLYGPTGNDRERLSVVARNVIALAPLYPERERDYERRIDEVLSLGSGPDAGGNMSLPKFLLLSVAFALHIIPYRIVGRLAQWASPTDLELGSSKLTFGAIVFLVWYAILFTLAFCFCGFGEALFALLVSLVLGWYLNRHALAYRWELLRLVLPGKSRSSTILCRELIEELEALRVE